VKTHLSSTREDCRESPLGGGEMGGGGKGGGCRMKKRKKGAPVCE